MQSLRHQRVRELLKREIGEIIRREIPTGEAGLITVNDVGLAGDLQSAIGGVIGQPATLSRRKINSPVDGSRAETQLMLP